MNISALDLGLPTIEFSPPSGCENAMSTLFSTSIASEPVTMSFIATDLQEHDANTEIKPSPQNQRTCVKTESVLKTASVQKVLGRQLQAFENTLNSHLGSSLQLNTQLQVYLSEIRRSISLAKDDTLCPVMRLFQTRYTLLRQTYPLQLAKVHVILRVTITMFSTLRGFCAWFPFIVRSKEYYVLDLENATRLIRYIADIKVTKRDFKLTFTSLLGVNWKESCISAKDVRPLLQNIGIKSNRLDSYPFLALGLCNFEDLCRFTAQICPEVKCDSPTIQRSIWKRCKERGVFATAKSACLGFTWHKAPLQAIFRQSSAHVTYSYETGRFSENTTLKSPVAWEIVQAAHGPSIRDETARFYNDQTALSRFSHLLCWDEGLHISSDIPRVGNARLLH